MKVSELKGAKLDLWVARANGIKGAVIIQSVGGGTYCWLDVSSRVIEPSTDWSQGGPIIERERISVEYEGDHAGWGATYDAGFHSLSTWTRRGFGSTPLIAAMRCFVASKFGETVED